MTIPFVCFAEICFQVWPFLSTAIPRVRRLARKKFFSLIFVSIIGVLSSCGQNVQTQQITIVLSELEGVPADTIGSFLCTVTYIPNEELFATIKNDSQFILLSGCGEGDLYRQDANSEWDIMEVEKGPTFPEGAAIWPGETSSEDIFMAYGFYAPKLETGMYALVFPVRLKSVDEETDEQRVELTIPFSVN